MDGEDLPSPLLLAAFCCGGQVVCSLLPGAQQPVVHQPLPGATQVRPVELGGGGGWSTIAPPDGVASGEDCDSVVPERRRRSHRREDDEQHPEHIHSCGVSRVSPKSPTGVQTPEEPLKSPPALQKPPERPKKNRRTWKSH